jgi:4-hydroxybenzoate polyprenyltransferase
MLNILDFLDLLRVKQWYKNIVIFIPLIFSLKFFNINSFLLILFGFFLLSLISSASYIINDLRDIEKDKYHPEKCKRPLASGKIKKTPALIISGLLFILSLAIAFRLSKYFFLSLLGLFLLSQLYTFFIRKIAFLDIVFISINFLIRAMSGTFLLNEPISFWATISPFLISMCLVSEKRYNELSIKDVEKYRPNLKQENRIKLKVISFTSIILLFVMFTAYSLVMDKPKLLISLPVSIYITYLFFSDSYKNPLKIRNPEKFVFQPKVIISLIIWTILILLLFYNII